jgi:histidinol-phosphate aminotransferase
MRTLSKFGLAGVRLGYMLGHSALIKEIDKVRPPYNISILNCECALFALEHADVFAAQAANICAERTRLTITLRRMLGVTVWDSDANMILIRLEKPQASADLGIDSAQTVFDKLKAKGILIKNVSKMHPLLQNCLRLTVGTPAENTQMLAALQEIL